MSDDDLTADEAELEEDIDEDIDEELEAGIDDEVFVADDALLVDDEVDVAVEEPAPATPAKRSHTDDDDDEEDDFDADDVEEDLDTILKDRIAAGTDEEEEEEDAALDSEDRTNSANRVQPKRPEEFVCQSCFLVKHPSQLADAKHRLCADCV